MLRRPAMLGGVLRLVAVGVGGVAIAILLQQARAERLGEPALETVISEPAAVAPASGDPGSWSVRSGGWYIRVDSVVVDPDPRPQQRPAAPPASSSSSISAFDQVIAHHAKAEGFDWRLIAALIFEESRFNPTSRSDKGAYGLMQVRPIAAEAVGAARFKAPDDNVRTGVRYLRQLEEMFHEAHGRDRLSLVLAAYNMGPGHVRDAQLVARRLGYDPYRWNHAMDLMLPLLEEPTVYEQLSSGFAKGHETVAYVQRILNRYQRYRQKTASVPEIDADALSSSEPDSSNG